MKTMTIMNTMVTLMAMVMGTCMHPRVSGAHSPLA